MIAFYKFYKFDNGDNDDDDVFEGSIVQRYAKNELEQFWKRWCPEVGVFV